MFIDTHAHLDFPDFQPDLEAVLQRASNAGVTSVISIATDLDSSSRALDLATRFPNVYAAIGWHPSYAKDAPDDIRPALIELASHPKVVAIGETGLDYARLPENPEEAYRLKQKQASLFDQQLEVAAQLGLNCVIHQRQAMPDVFRHLDPFATKLRAVFHCFVDDPPNMQAVLARNSLVSFTGIATFKNAQTVRDTILATPIDRLMIETDSPYLAPVPYRGKRCEPAYAIETARTIASLKNCPIDDLARITSQTAQSFFRFPHDDLPRPN